MPGSSTAFVPKTANFFRIPQQSVDFEAPLVILHANANKPASRAIEPMQATFRCSRLNPGPLAVAETHSSLSIQVKRRHPHQSGISRQQIGIERRIARLPGLFELFESTHAVYRKRLHQGSTKPRDMGSAAENFTQIFHQRANVGALRTPDLQGQRVFITPDQLKLVNRNLTRWALYLNT